MYCSLDFHVEVSLVLIKRSSVSDSWGETKQWRRRFHRGRSWSDCEVASTKLSAVSTCEQQPSRPITRPASPGFILSDILKWHRCRRLGCWNKVGSRAHDGCTRIGNSRHFLLVVSLRQREAWWLAGGPCTHCNTGCGKLKHGTAASDRGFSHEAALPSMHPLQQTHCRFHPLAALTPRKASPV